MKDKTVITILNCGIALGVIAVILGTLSFICNMILLFGCGEK